MTVFFLLVGAAALIVGIWTYIVRTEPDHVSEQWRPADAGPAVDQASTRDLARADEALARVRHAPTAAAARGAMAGAMVAAERIGSARHAATARKMFVDRIHQLAAEAEMRGSPWKAADILEQCIPHAPNPAAVRKAMDALRGGPTNGGMRGGGIF